jgi:hypothetical protein
VPNNKLYILTLVTTLMILSEILLARNFWYLLNTLFSLFKIMYFEK